MVYHPDFAGLGVKVLASDTRRRCKEYRLESDIIESGTPVRYIEAKSGELFEVHVSIPSSCFVRYGVAARIEINGQTLHAQHVSKESGQSGWWSALEFRGTLNQVDDDADLVERRFRFSQPPQGRIENALQP
jgi:hypothetical protein